MAFDGFRCATQKKSQFSCSVAHRYRSLEIANCSLRYQFIELLAILIFIVCALTRHTSELLVHASNASKTRCHLFINYDFDLFSRTICDNCRMQRNDEKQNSNGKWSTTAQNTMRNCERRKRVNAINAKLITRCHKR